MKGRNKLSYAHTTPPRPATHRQKEALNEITVRHAVAAAAACTARLPAVARRQDVAGGSSVGTPSSWNSVGDFVSNSHRQSSDNARYTARQEPMNESCCGRPSHQNNAQQLRAAVTTHQDCLTAFENELLNEINLLRQDPRGYATFFEKEATLGYPYVNGNDVYFESEEAAQKINCNSLHVLQSTDVYDTSTTVPGAGVSVSECTVTSTETTAVGGRVDQGASELAEGSAGGHLPCTVAACGVEKMNLEQLRKHLACQQKRRAALEKDLRDVKKEWHERMHALRVSLTAGDDKALKRVKRNNSRKRQSLLSHEEILRQRTAAAEQLRQAYASRLRDLEEELGRVRGTCKRAVAGANLILDCIRSLKEMVPVPPLQGSRGLALAARDVGGFFYRDTAREESLQVMHDAALACISPSEATGAAGDHSLGEQLALAPFLDGAANAMSLENIGGAASSRNGAASVRPEVPDCPLNGTDTLKWGSSTMRVAPQELRAEIDSLTDTTREACGTYGYLTGDFRGLQLFGHGSPRELVMRMLLGVTVPVFGSCAALSNRCRTLRCSVSGADAALSHHGTASVTGFDVSLFNPRNFAGDLSTQESLRATAAHSLRASKHITGLLLGGVFHPCSLGASILAHDEDEETTSAGKRAAAAALRLGPLLWRGAHLLGLSWQSVSLAKHITTYDNRETDVVVIPELITHRNVCTTVILASSFEELDLIHKRANLTLDEVRRIIHEVPKGKQLWPAVVNLHSRLGVSLLQPSFHPLVVQRDQDTAWIAVQADARRVHVVATVTLSDEATPSHPFFDAREVLIQRSDTDVNVVLVLVDLRAALERSRGAPILLHLFERDKQNGASGFEPIGFIRIVPEADDTVDCLLVKSPRSSRDGCRYTPSDLPPLANDRSASRAAPLLLSSAVPQVRTPMQTLLGATPPMYHHLIRNLDLNSRHSGNMPHTEMGRHFTSTSRRREKATHRDTGATGWPILSASFSERGGTLFSPLSSTLAASQGRQRVAVQIPLCRDYLRAQLAVIEKALADARAIEEVECPLCEGNPVEGVVKEVEEMTSVNVPERETSGSPTKDSLSVYNASAHSSLMSHSNTCQDMDDSGDQSAIKGFPHDPVEGKPRGAKAASFTVSTGQARSRRVSNIRKGRPSRRASRTDTARERKLSLFSIPSVTVAPEIIALLPLVELRRSAEQVADAAKVGRRQYHMASKIMDEELILLEKEIPKRKGRELLRVLRDKETIENDLKGILRQVEALEHTAAELQREVVHRERERAFRLSRIGRLEKELNVLRCRIDRATPLSVKLWFAGGDSVLRATPEDGAYALAYQVTDPSSRTGKHSGGDGTVTQPLASHHTDDNNVVALHAVDAELTRYEAPFTVPADFKGRAVLLIDGQESVSWEVVKDS